MRQQYKSLGALCPLLCSILICGKLDAQQHCTITGRVTNHKNLPLVYANVFLKNRFEGATTDDTGRFFFKSASRGQVTLVCNYVGYAPFERELSLMPGEVYEVDITLKKQEIRAKTVTVTASAFTAADGEGVTLSSLDVVRTPGAAADLFWAIKSFPGLQQVEEGAGLFVRGGDVSETVMMLDGAVINHPYRFESPTGGFFGTFSPFLQKGTFFSSGGFSAQYGNALSGALVMESQDLPAKRMMGLGLGLAAESAYIAVPVISDKFGFSFSGNVSNTWALFELNNNTREFSQYPSSFDLNLNVVYKAGSHSLKAFVFRAADNIGIEVDDPDFSTDFRGDNANELYNLRYRGVIGRNVLLNANVAYSDFAKDIQLTVTDTTSSEFSDVIDLDLNDRLYQARVTTEFLFDRDISLIVGSTVFDMRTGIKGRMLEDDDVLSLTAPTEIIATDYGSVRTAQFLELTFPGVFGMHFIYGLHGEYESLSGDYTIDPRVSAVLPLGDATNLTAAWGQYHQFPEPLFYDPHAGNPNSTSTKATHYILGLSYDRASTIFRIEGYYKDYDELLLEHEEQNYTNAGYGYARGIDVFGKHSIGRFSGRASYSWLKARRKWLDLPVLASPYFDITNNFTLVLNIDLPKMFSIGASYRYATGKPYSTTAESLNDARVPDYQKLDMTFSYMHSFFDSNFTIFYFSVSNLLNRINIFDYRYSADYERRDPVESSIGRSVYFGVSFNM